MWQREELSWAADGENGGSLQHPEAFLGSVPSCTSGKQQGEHTWRQDVSLRWADAGEEPRSLPSQADAQDCMVQEVLEEALPTAHSSSSSNDFLRLQF